MDILTSAARKAQVAALIGFLGPLAAFVGSDEQWSWRAFVSAVITSAVAGLTVYLTTNSSSTQAAEGRHSV